MCVEIFEFHAEIQAQISVVICTELHEKQSGSTGPPRRALRYPTMLLQPTCIVFNATKMSHWIVQHRSGGPRVRDEPNAI